MTISVEKWLKTMAYVNERLFKDTGHKWILSTLYDQNTHVKKMLA